jgi:glycosyltransferase involved in cell wall biosynthesis
MSKFPFWKAAIWNALVLLFLPIFILAAVLPSRHRRTLVWGSIPILTNKYWSDAMREVGHDSVTIMQAYFSINARSDFDRYFEDFAPSFLPLTLQRGLGGCLALCWVLRRARAVHLSFLGFALDSTFAWRLEAWLFKRAGVRVVILPFGADFYVYSRLIDTSLRYGLLASYPDLALHEARTVCRLDHWSTHADAVVAGMMVDGLGRWDVALNQFFVIDTAAWTARQHYSTTNGRNGAVRVLHTPNHRGFKGTEFLVAAVDTLRTEGLQVELVMLERVPNTVVRETMGQVDILAEQFLATGYALSGIEGMASGLPVMANLEHAAYTQVFRRFGFLDECPILSTTPETLVDQLRLLVTRPDLRQALGEASRAFAVKYHGFQTAQYLFGSIYDRLDGKDVDLINLFHPLKSDFNNRTPRIVHPLRNNLFL